MMQCLKDIIGVTNSGCICLVEGLTSEQVANLAKTTSGLYLDDLEGGVHMKALKYADLCVSYYNMAMGAINNAIKMVQDDLIVALNAKYVKAKRAFVGDIGRVSFAQTLNDTHRWQGIRLRPYDYSDGVIIINKLQIVVDTTVDFHLSIYRAPVDTVVGELVNTFSINAIANAWYTQNISSISPIRLPLVVDENLVEYWIVYDRDEPGIPFFPKDNKIQCSTCDQNKSSQLGDFVTASGVGFSDINALHNVNTDTYAHGINLGVSIKCDNENLFCREYKQDDAIAVTMAHATRYKAGELLIEEVLKSPDVNRYTTMAREYLWGKRNHFRKEYESRIMYLASVINVDDSNCYVCRESANQPFTAGIFK